MPRWPRSPVHNWIGVFVSLAMLILYLQRLVGPDTRPSTPWVTAAWAIMFLTWLSSAIYKTWIKKK